MEFREMRRKKQELSYDECIKILEKNTSGVLSVLGDGGYPYAVPLNYVYFDNKIYFHCARSGHKLDAVKNCDKASFCVINQDVVVPEEYTSHYQSVILFGRASVVTNEAEIHDSITKLAIKYAPNDTADNRNKAIENDYNLLCMLKIEIEHITGKQAKELMNN
ncbi:MAG: pyridoxamine 5'-phosphate oxidase family protein [Clostridiales bacterium]|nr:pyridoxamine 5'-phosphate oxidase family protein [Clostridiales bacterium]